MSGGGQYIFTVHIFLLVCNHMIQMPKTGEQTKTAESCTGAVSHWEGTVTHAEEVNEYKSDVCMKELVSALTDVNYLTGSIGKVRGRTEPIETELTI